MAGFDMIPKDLSSHVQYRKSDNIVQDLKEIIDSAPSYAYSSVNVALVFRNWLVGKRISEEELKGDRAKYGTELIKNISSALTQAYGSGFTQSSVYRFVQFYEMFPDIFASPGRKSGLLSWTHYHALLQVHDSEARVWYENEAFSETWSARTLQRNISTQYYYRLLKSQDKRPVKEEMLFLTSKYQQDKLEFIKNPVIAEFLGISKDTSYLESDLEQFIIAKKYTIFTLINRQSNGGIFYEPKQCISWKSHKETNARVLQKFRE